jgi:putative endonuclease
MKTWFVYIIRCTDDSLYTGSTSNVIHRWGKHTEGKGAKYLQAHTPESMVLVEEHANRSQACKREYEIKQLSKQKKELLIAGAGI